MAAAATGARAGSEAHGGLRILPRRAQANSRAVIGGLAVSLAVVLVFAAWLGTRPGRPLPYAVTRLPLAAGERLTAGDLTTRALRLPAAVASSAFPATSSLLGRVLAVAVPAGQLISSPELTPAATQPALRPVAIEAPAFELAGLGPGQRVDVLLTTGSGSAERTTLIFRGAEVIRVYSSSGGLLGGGSGSEVVTLGVPDLQDVESLVSATHAGTIDLVVAEPSDGTGGGPGG